jgi:hypothetical protein
MTTQEPTAPVEVPAVAEAEPEPTGEGNPQLREARDRAVTKADNLTKELVEVRLGQIGLSPDEGLGVAIAEGFKGDPTLEEITAFATEKYKYVYDPANPAAGQTTVAETLAAGQVNEGQAVMEAARSVQPDDERLAQANQTDRKLSEGETPTDQEITSGISAKMNLARG